MLCTCFFSFFFCHFYLLTFWNICRWSFLTQLFGQNLFLSLFQYKNWREQAKCWYLTFYWNYFSLIFCSSAGKLNSLWLDSGSELPLVVDFYQMCRKFLSNQKNLSNGTGFSKTRRLALENVINRIIEQWDPLQLYFIFKFIEVNGLKLINWQGRWGGGGIWHWKFIFYFYQTF